MLRSFCSDSQSGKQNQSSSTVLKMDFHLRGVWFDSACGTWSQNFNIFWGKIESLFWDQLVECDWGVVRVSSVFSPILWQVAEVSETPWSLFSPQYSYQACPLHGNCEQELCAGEPKCWERMRKGKFLEKWNETSCELSNQERPGPVFIFQVRPKMQPPLCPCLNKTVVLAEYLFCRTSIHQFSTWNILGWKAVFAGGERCLTWVTQGKTGFLCFNWSWMVFGCDTIFLCSGHWCL